MVGENEVLILVCHADYWGTRFGIDQPAWFTIMLGMKQKAGKPFKKTCFEAFYRVL